MAKLILFVSTLILLVAQQAMSIRRTVPPTAAAMRLRFEEWMSESGIEYEEDAKEKEMRFEIFKGNDSTTLGVDQFTYLTDNEKIESHFAGADLLMVSSSVWICRQSSGLLISKGKETLDHQVGRVRGKEIGNSYCSVSYSGLHKVGSFLYFVCMEMEEKLLNEMKNEVGSSQSAASPSSPPVHKAQDTTGIVEDGHNGHNWKKKNLFLEIPTTTLEGSPPAESVVIKMPPTTPRKVNFLLTPTSADCGGGGGGVIGSLAAPTPSRGRSSLKSLLPKLSFKSRISTLNAGKPANLPPETASFTAIQQGQPSIIRSLSLTKLFTPRMKRTSSLPLTPDSMHSENISGTHNPTSEGPLNKIARSRSVPELDKEGSIRGMDSFFRVIPSTPRLREGDITAHPSSPAVSVAEDDDGEDIPEEEAVCRICLVELCEGGETLKMECSCKGELALAHQECAVKWFSIKGNKTCDVGRMGTGAIAISLPFSCVLGLLSSMISSTMGRLDAVCYFIFFKFCSDPSSISLYVAVKRRFVYFYASNQFALVVLFAHIFYSLVGVQAVLSVLLSTFAGFGVAMSVSSIITEFVRWRRRWRTEQQLGNRGMMAAGGSIPIPANSATATATATAGEGRSHHTIDVANP
ncbi:hypothetical protein LINGRAHAP2_LOCUS29661 [Linum grandiflorum]